MTRVSGRRRIVICAERLSTLKQIRQIIGRQADILVAGDLATVTAVLRLYNRIDAFITETTTARSLPMSALSLIRQARPGCSRILVVEQDVAQGVYDAVRDQTVTHLQFLPLRPDDLLQCLGLTVPTQSSNEKPGSTPSGKKTVAL